MLNPRRVWLLRCMTGFLAAGGFVCTVGGTARISRGIAAVRCPTPPLGQRVLPFLSQQLCENSRARARHGQRAADGLELGGVGKSRPQASRTSDAAGRHAPTG